MKMNGNVSERVECSKLADQWYGIDTPRRNACTIRSAIVNFHMSTLWFWQQFKWDRTSLFGGFCCWNGADCNGGVTLANTETATKWEIDRESNKWVNHQLTWFYFDSARTKSINQKNYKMFHCSEVLRDEWLTCDLHDYIDYVDIPSGGTGGGGADRRWRILRWLTHQFDATNRRFPLSNNSRMVWWDQWEEWSNKNGKTKCDKCINCCSIH